MNKLSMHEDWQEVLRSALEGYCLRQQSTPSAVGRALFNDSSFFTDVLERGRQCSVDKWQAAMRFLHHDLLGVE